MKSSIPKRKEKKSLDKEKGAIILLWSGELSGSFVLVQMGHTHKDQWKNSVVVCV
jgi:hypothetical protein